MPLGYAGMPANTRECKEITCVTRCGLFAMADKGAPQSVPIQASDRQMSADVGAQPFSAVRLTAGAVAGGADCQNVRGLPVHSGRASRTASASGLTRWTC
jgi:hypothetical protein